MRAVRLNGPGNSYPEGQPVYEVEVMRGGSWFPEGSVIEVMDSLNPSFAKHWRINDSQFIRKEFCRHTNG